MLQNILGNSTKNYLSVYYGISLLVILPTKSKDIESNTKDDDNLQKWFEKEKIPKSKVNRLLMMSDGQNI